MVKQTHLVALTLALVWLCSGAIGIAVAQESAKSSDSKNKTYFLNSDCQNAQSSQEKPKVGRSGAAKAGFAMMLLWLKEPERQVGRITFLPQSISVQNIHVQITPILRITHFLGIMQTI